MRLRSILAISLSMMILGGCGGNETSEKVDNTFKATVNLIDKSGLEIVLRNCLLTTKDTDKSYDSEIINLRNVASFRTEQTGEPSKELHILYIDQRVITIVSDVIRLQASELYEKCSGRY